MSRAPSRAGWDVAERYGTEGSGMLTHAGIDGRANRLAHRPIDEILADASRSP